MPLLTQGQALNAVDFLKNVFLTKASAFLADGKLSYDITTDPFFPHTGLEWCYQS